MSYEYTEERPTGSDACFTLGATDFASAANP
jgi:hypothetical protein